MTSTVRNYKGARGFSLTEIVIALMIAGLVLGGAVGVMTYSSDEHALKKAAGEMEMMAKRARAAAILQQTPYALEFRQGVVRMMPWAQAAADRGDEEIPMRAESWELSLDNGMTARVRRWNSDEWVGARENSSEIWRFDPNGLCEPIGVELKLKESSALLEFNLLTGAIREAEYRVQ